MEILNMNMRVFINANNKITLAQVSSNHTEVIEISADMVKPLCEELEKLKQEIEG